MSVTLAIDTSTRTGRLAVAAGETVIFAAEFGTERSHNSEIFAPLEAALAACAGAPERIAVGTGPGSYTGVRIGIAAGLGIALAKGVPIAGFSSTCFAAAADQSEAHLVVGDARRGSLFIAKIEAGKLGGEPELVESPRELPRPLFTFDHHLPSVPAATPTHPSASKLAVHAAMLPEAEFNQLAETPPEPIYLRPPFITQPKKAGKAVPAGDPPHQQ